MADGNTIAEQIADIAASKAAIAQAIAAKGVTVPEDAKLADLAPLVGQISGGGTSGPYTCEIDRNTMTELVIPEGTTKIGNYAFYGCNALTSLTIPNSVTTIGIFAFYGCNTLTSLTIPDSVTSIGDYAFRDCNALTSLTIPDSVTSIGGHAFRRCFLLTSLTIPESVTNIGIYAFSQCPSYCNITFAKTMAEVSGMSDYPWDISSGAVIHCTDGDLTVS